MNTKKVEKLAPAALQKLAGLYLGYDIAIKSAKKKQEEVREQLLAQVQHYGAAAPKADKTQRLETGDFVIDVSQGHSVEISDERVEEFRTKCEPGEELRMFHLMFEARRYFVKLPGAESLIAKSRAPLQRLFAKCLEIKPTSPRLSVKEKKES